MALQDRKNANFIQALKCAFHGLKTAFKSERNLKIDLLAACGVLILGLVLGLEARDWLWLILAMTLVFLAELLNTALEFVVDLAADNQWHPLAKKAKDVAAGAVLMAAFQAVVIGIIILGPYLMAWLS